MGAFFVRRPIVAIVLSIVTVLLGVLALRGLPVAKFPDIVPPEVQISATYTGADALTVEQSVATPLELVLATIASVSGLCGLGMLVEGRAIFSRRGRQRTRPRARGLKWQSVGRSGPWNFVQRHKP